MYGVIYKVTCTINGKIYVGQTTLTIQERFNAHSKADSLLGKDIRKFGKENFKIEVIEECETDEQPALSKKDFIYRLIGAKIAYYRTLRQMSQAELAKRANLSSSTLGRIERGKYNKGVPISTLLDIAEALRIELSALVTFSEEEKKVWWEIDKHML